jgi:hypothetical protein
VPCDDTDSEGEAELVSLSLDPLAIAVGAAAVKPGEDDRVDARVAGRVRLPDVEVGKAQLFDARGKRKLQNGITFLTTHSQFRSHEQPFKIVSCLPLPDIGPG